MFSCLRHLFSENISKFVDNQWEREMYWREIYHNYTKPKRHYHNLNHVEAVIKEIEIAKEAVKDWFSMLMAIYYHDIIYDSSANDNEEKSAELAELRLNKMGVDAQRTNQIGKLILATKSHQITSDLDTNFLLDADLAILGKPPADYKIYTEQIRKEFSQYSEDIYTAARKRVLQHFIKMEHLYKTERFRSKYELQARKNIAGELKLL